MTAEENDRDGETPTNGGAQESTPQGAQASKEQATNETELAPEGTQIAFELEWLVPHFGVPVTVQLSEPIWLVRASAAMLVRGPQGEKGVLGIPSLATDKEGNTGSSDVFENVVLQPAHCGTHVVIMQKSNDDDPADLCQTLYTVRPDQIRAVSQAVPSRSQVERAVEQARNPLIKIPGAPNNEGGQLIR